MNVLDLVIFVPIIIGFVFGLFKGLVRELTSLAAIVLGIMGARILEPKMSMLLMSVLDMQLNVARPVSYLVLFILIAVLLLLVANMVDKLFSAIALGWLNKLHGGVFAAVKWALIVSVLLNVLNVFDSRFSFFKEETKKESIAYEPILKLGPILWQEAQDLFLNMPNEESN